MQALINITFIVSYTTGRIRRTAQIPRLCVVHKREITKDAATTRRVQLNLNSTRLVPMFSQSSTFHTPDNMADRIRPPLGHSSSQSSLHASFSIGGVPNTTGTHHPHGTSSWASSSQNNTLSNSLNDPFLQSRSSYQSGYLMVCYPPRGVWSPSFTFVYF